MEGRCQRLPQEIKKQLPVPFLGQELHSCDTTQIDVKTSTRFTRHHACPMDNGWVPVGQYLEFSPFRPPSEVHSHDRSPPRLHCPGLAAGSHLSATTLPQRFAVIHLLLSLYPPAAALSTLFFDKSLKQGNKKDRTAKAVRSLMSFFRIALRD